ncbi:hypothetical protein AB1287_12940 [Enterobacter asburiae]|uniref:hypothetical protein n=1 Tax=Scandinavium sp. UTDF21-P1B TaxID=3446379 RepID=UPI003471708F
MMKEILSSQYDTVSGGWQDQDGSGRKSSTNGGSASGGGNSGNGGFQSFVSQNSPYGSGSGANGYWGNSSNGNSNGGLWGGRDHIGTNR